MSKSYTVSGYNRSTGSKQIIRVRASSSKEARTKAYGQLTYPKVLLKLLILIVLFSSNAYAGRWQGLISSVAAVKAEEIKSYEIFDLPKKIEVIDPSVKNTECKDGKCAFAPIPDNVDIKTSKTKQMRVTKKGLFKRLRGK